jgi:hypothetical protein
MKIQNNIHLSKCTEQEGIDLFKLAGYEVTVADHTFAIWADGRKVMGCSNKDQLQNPSFIMCNLIQKMAYRNGVEKGKEIIQNAIKKTLNIS